jgi:hypothetical protein
LFVETGGKGIWTFPLPPLLLPPPMLLLLLPPEILSQAHLPAAATWTTRISDVNS